MNKINEIILVVYFHQLRRCVWSENLQETNLHCSPSFSQSEEALLPPCANPYILDAR